MSPEVALLEELLFAAVKFTVPPFAVSVGFHKMVSEQFLRPVTLFTVVNSTFERVGDVLVSQFVGVKILHRFKDFATRFTNDGGYVYF